MELGCMTFIRLNFYSESDKRVFEFQSLTPLTTNLKWFDD